MGVIGRSKIKAKYIPEEEYKGEMERLKKMVENEDSIQDERSEILKKMELLDDVAQQNVTRLIKDCGDGSDNELAYNFIYALSKTADIVEINSAQRLYLSQIRQAFAKHALSKVPRMKKDILKKEDIVEYAGMIESISGIERSESYKTTMENMTEKHVDEFIKIIKQYNVHHYGLDRLYYLTAKAFCRRFLYAAERVGFDVIFQDSPYLLKILEEVSLPKDNEMQMNKIPEKKDKKKTKKNDEDLPQYLIGVDTSVLTNVYKPVDCILNKEDAMRIFVEDENAQLTIAFKRFMKQSQSRLNNIDDVKAMVSKIPHCDLFIVLEKLKEHKLGTDLVICNEMSEADTVKTFLIHIIKNIENFIATSDMENVNELYDLYEKFVNCGTVKAYAELHNITFNMEKFEEDDVKKDRNLRMYYKPIENNTSQNEKELSQNIEKVLDIDTYIKENTIEDTFFVLLNTKSLENRMKNGEFQISTNIMTELIESYTKSESENFVNHLFHFIQEKYFLQENEENKTVRENLEKMLLLPEFVSILNFDHEKVKSYYEKYMIKYDEIIETDIVKELMKIDESWKVLHQLHVQEKMIFIYMYGNPENDTYNQTMNLHNTLKNYCMSSYGINSLEYAYDKVNHKNERLSQIQINLRNLNVNMCKLALSFEDEGDFMKTFTKEDVYKLQQVQFDGTDEENIILMSQILDESELLNGVREYIEDNDMLPMISQHIIDYKADPNPSTLATLINSMNQNQDIITSRDNLNGTFGKEFGEFLKNYELNGDKLLLRNEITEKFVESILSLESDDVDSIFFKQYLSFNLAPYSSALKDYLGENRIDIVSKLQEEKKKKILKPVKVLPVTIHFDQQTINRMDKKFQNERMTKVTALNKKLVETWKYLEDNDFHSLRNVESKIRNSIIQHINNTNLLDEDQNTMIHSVRLSILSFLRSNTNLPDHTAYPLVSTLFKHPKYHCLFQQKDIKPLVTPYYLFRVPVNLRTLNISTKIMKKAIASTTEEFSSSILNYTDGQITDFVREKIRRNPTEQITKSQKILPAPKYAQNLGFSCIKRNPTVVVAILAVLALPVAYTIYTVLQYQKVARKNRYKNKKDIPTHT